MKKTICVDLDGVVAQYDGWKGVDHIGEPIPGAVEFTVALAHFADVVIFTTRCNPEVNKPEAAHLLVNRVRDWLDKHSITYHHIYSGVGKPIASAYVDDRSVVCRPQKDIENQDFDTALRLCRALAAGHELGSQGTHSDGHLTADDEGDMKLMVGRQNGCVRIDFGKPVGWLAFPKDQAMALAGLIVKHAEAL